MKYKLILCFCFALVVSCQEENNIEPNSITAAPIDLSNIRVGQSNHYQRFFSMNSFSEIKLFRKYIVTIEENETHIFLLETEVTGESASSSFIKPNAKYLEVIEDRRFTSSKTIGGFDGDTIQLDETLAVSVQQDGVNINLDSIALPEGIVGKLNQFSLVNQAYDNVLVMKKEIEHRSFFIFYNKNQILMSYYLFPSGDIDGIYLVE
jgi:hypothetical protein